MLIVPEGGRSPDGWGQPFRGGAAYLSSRCDVPIVPFHIQGTARILRKGAKLPTPANVRVTYGTPLRPPEGESASRFPERMAQEGGTPAHERREERRGGQDGAGPGWTRGRA